MEHEVFFSIIIPHKNTPELLQRCLNSIPRKDDIQIIIVDDNSDPEIVNFEKFPGLNDPNIELVFTIEGKGAGYARNIGLTKAKGKWLLFADADDYFTNDFLDYIDKYKNSDFDLIYFGKIMNNIKTNKKTNNCKLIRDIIHYQNYDTYKYTSHSPWGKLVRHSLIIENDIKFEETMVSNDKLFSIKTAYYSKNTHFDEFIIYIYEFGGNSLTSKKTLKSHFDRFIVNVHENIFLNTISKTKYKINIIPRLKNLINIHDMTYFHKAIAIMRENNINLFIEIIKFTLLWPIDKIIKLKMKYLNRNNLEKEILA